MEGIEELSTACKILEGEPREWECLYAQALARCNAGQVEVAIGLLRRCLQLQPASIPVWHLLVLALSASPKRATEEGKCGASTVPEAWTLAETAWKELVVEGDSWTGLSTARKMELMKLRCSAMWILRAYKGPTKALEECRLLLSLFAKMFPSVMTTDERTVDTLLRTMPRKPAPGYSTPVNGDLDMARATQSPTNAVASLAGSAVPPRPASPAGWLDKDALQATGPDGSPEAESIPMKVLSGTSAGAPNGVSSPFVRSVSISSVNTGLGSSAGSFGYPSGAMRHRINPIPFVPDHLTNTYQFAPYDILLHLWLSASYMYRDLLMPEQAFAALDEAFKVVTDVQRREVRRGDGPSTLNLLTGIVDVRGDPVKSKGDVSAGPMLKKRGWRYEMAPRRVRRIIVDVEIEVRICVS